MSSGGKGGKSSSSVKIPSWVQNRAKEMLADAGNFADVGYMPYYGPDVAAFTAPQLQSMQGTGAAAQAFGLAGPDFNALQSIAAPQQFANGTVGYSSGGLFDQAVAELAAKRPGQFNQYQNQFVNPYDGSLPAQSQQQVASALPQWATGLPYYSDPTQLPGA